MYSVSYSCIYHFYFIHTWWGNIFRVTFSVTFPRYIFVTFPRYISALHFRYISALHFPRNIFVTFPRYISALHFRVTFPLHFRVTFSAKHFPRYWPFVRGIHRSPVNTAHKGQWRGALMFSLICVWNGWVNSREAGDLDAIAPIMTAP